MEALEASEASEALEALEALEAVGAFDPGSTEVLEASEALLALDAQSSEALEVFHLGRREVRSTSVTLSDKTSNEAKRENGVNAKPTVFFSKSDKVPFMLWISLASQVLQTATT